ncbi:hypothetical protein [uncultured Veillonella sp.]|uniref:hypothetical protein n=1 Tax=uncultured Veillonella sp. TaxID=159268 RepID=UPI002608D69F|nr:hypothetical protein [uncultured Veillonella sp.]
MASINTSYFQREILKPYEALGIKGDAIINEIVRAIAMKRIIDGTDESFKTNPAAVPAQLLLDTAKVTEGDFGPLPYNELLVDPDAVKALYVNSVPGATDCGALPMIVSEMGYGEGISGSEFLALPIKNIVTELAHKEGIILFAYVEEYINLLPWIMTQISPERLLFYIPADTTAGMVKELCPTAPITTEWPDDVIFDHIVAASTGLFRAPVTIMEELATRVGNTTEDGTAHILIPISAVQDQMGINRMAIQFMLLQKRLNLVREWAPLGVYEFVYMPEEVKKVKLLITEVLSSGFKSTGPVEEGVVRDTSFIALPHEVLASMDTFSLVAYGLSLCGIAPALQAQLPTLGEDGYMAVDTKLPAYRQKLMYAAGGMKLVVKRQGTTPSVALVPLEPTISLSGSMGEEEYEELVKTDLPTMREDEAFWFFPDERAAYIWYSFFTSQKGQRILKTLAQMVVSTPALLQLMGSVRRQIIKGEALDSLVAALKDEALIYDRELAKVKAAHEARMDSFSEEIIPDTMRFDN